MKTRDGEAKVWNVYVKNRKIPALFLGTLLFFLLRYYNKFNEKKMPHEIMLYDIVHRRAFGLS